MWINNWIKSKVKRAKLTCACDDVGVSDIAVCSGYLKNAVPLPEEVGPSSWILTRCDLLGTETVVCNDGCTAAVRIESCGDPAVILSQFSINISTTILWNLISIMEATVSSSGRSRVGPKHTAKFPTVIKFLSLFLATLKFRINFFLYCIVAY